MCSMHPMYLSFPQGEVHQPSFPPYPYPTARYDVTHNDDQVRPQLKSSILHLLRHFVALDIIPQLASRRAGLFLLLSSNRRPGLRLTNRIRKAYREWQPCPYMSRRRLYFPPFLLRTSSIQEDYITRLNRIPWGGHTPSRG